MKSLCSLVLALGGVAGFANAARADATRVTGVVETAHAVFFQPSQFPTVVWFFPRTQLDLEIVPPQLPTGTFWRASVGFKQITADDLAALPPEWNGKSFVPFIVRPTTECTLTRLTEMRFVTQEVKALGRDISAATAPVCRFSLRMPTVMTPDVQARWDALVQSDKLVERVLDIELKADAKIAWAEVHAAIAAVLAPTPPDPEPAPEPDPETRSQLALAADLTPEDARAAIATALASPALAVVHDAVTPAEAQAFVDATFTTLFARATGGLVHLVETPPTSSVAYHLATLHFFQ